MTTTLSVITAQVPQTPAVALGSALEGNLPEVVVNRAGCFDVATRLVAQGRLEGAAAYIWMLQGVVSTQNYGGYALPWRTLEDMAQAVRDAGFTLESVHFLYQANLLAYPQGGKPGTVYSRPGYDGVLRVVRGGTKVWSVLCACLH